MAESAVGGWPPQFHILVFDFFAGDSEPVLIYSAQALLILGDNFELVTVHREDMV